MNSPYPPVKEQFCGNCYYRRNLNECRRRAPSALINAFGETCWPNIDKEDWCGEWAPQEAVQ